MNKIDLIIKTLGLFVGDIKNIVKYTRDDMYTNKNIPNFRCSNDDTYIEIVFGNDVSLCLGGYMKINHPNDRIKEEIEELLYKASINDFHQSDFFKELDTKYCD